MFREGIPRSAYFIGSIEVKKSSTALGLGVFATDDISKYTCIEAAPYISFTPALMLEWEETGLGSHILKNYIFKGPNAEHVLSLGYGSIYNHDPEPTAKWEWREKPNKAHLFYAIKDIKKGEEIFIRYNIDSNKLDFLDDAVRSRLDTISDYKEKS